jgi:hypothetical protein
VWFYKAICIFSVYKLGSYLLARLFKKSFADFATVPIIEWSKMCVLRVMKILKIPPPPLKKRRKKKYYIIIASLYTTD